MRADGKRGFVARRAASALVLAPGCALMLVVLAVNLVGDWLRDRLDVRGRLSARVLQ